MSASLLQADGDENKNPHNAALVHPVQQTTHTAAINKSFREIKGPSISTNSRNERLQTPDPKTRHKCETVDTDIGCSCHHHATHVPSVIHTGFGDILSMAAHNRQANQQRHANTQRITQQINSAGFRSKQQDLRAQYGDNFAEIERDRLNKEWESKKTSPEEWARLRRDVWPERIRRDRENGTLYQRPPTVQEQKALDAKNKAIKQEKRKEKVLSYMPTVVKNAFKTQT